MLLGRFGYSSREQRTGRQEPQTRPQEPPRRRNLVLNLPIGRAVQKNLQDRNADVGVVAVGERAGSGRAQSRGQRRLVLRERDGEREGNGGSNIFSILNPKTAHRVRVADAV